jgi:hypothetical protein
LSRLGATRIRTNLRNNLHPKPSESGGVTTDARGLQLFAPLSRLPGLAGATFGLCVCVARRQSCRGKPARTRTWCWIDFGEDALAAFGRIHRTPTRLGGPHMTTPTMTTTPNKAMPTSNKMARISLTSGSVLMRIRPADYDHIASDRPGRNARVLSARPLQRTIPATGGMRAEAFFIHLTGTQVQGQWAAPWRRLQRAILFRC